MTTKWYWTAGAVYIALVVLGHSPVTMIPADAKALLLLAGLPIVLFLFTGRPEHYFARRKITLGAAIAPALFVWYGIVVCVNWYLKSLPYYGNRALIFAWVCGGAFLAGAFSPRTPLWRRFFRYSVIGAVSFAAAYALGEYFGYVPVMAPARKFPPELVGLVGHKNTLGFMIMAVLPWSVSIALKYHELTKKMRVAAVSCVGILCVALVLLDSRGSLFLGAAAVGACLFFYFRRAGWRIDRRTRYALYLLIVCAACIPAFVWDEKIWIRTARLFLGGFGTSARSVFYTAQLRMFLENPLTGVGLGNFVTENRLYWPQWFRAASGFTLPLRGHCDYLETLSELGLSGFIPFICLWFGGLAIGIKRFRSGDGNVDIPDIVMLAAMMLHASFSTASRHFPAGTLLWFMLGVMWRTGFLETWRFVPRKGKRYTAAGLLTLHLAVIALFVQITTADAFFLSFARDPAMDTGKFIRLRRALKICPWHREALFKSATLSLGVKEYAFARDCADALDSLAPNTNATDYIRAVAAGETGNYQEALRYAEMELENRPWFWHARKIRAEALARLGHCTRLNVEQAITRGYFRRGEDSRNALPKTPEQWEQRFRKESGAFRYLLRGPFLRRAYQIRMRGIGKEKLENRNFQQQILSLECVPSGMDD